VESVFPFSLPGVVGVHPALSGQIKVEA